MAPPMSSDRTRATAHRRQARATTERRRADRTRCSVVMGPSGRDGAARAARDAAVRSGVAAVRPAGTSRRARVVVVVEVGGDGEAEPAGSSCGVDRQADGADDGGEGERRGGGGDAAGCADGYGRADGGAGPQAGADGLSVGGHAASGGSGSMSVHWTGTRLPVCVIHTTPSPSESWWPSEPPSNTS